MPKITFEKTATLADVAKAAGVSKGTASNVFNRPEIVREEVRNRVREAAKAIGYYGPDPKGRLLSAGKVNAIGVATVKPLGYFFEDPFARVLMTGITEACDASGTGISLVSAPDKEELAWSMHSAPVDGFILFCLEGAERLIALSRERQLPFVALAFGDGDETTSVVSIDNAAAAHTAATHLAELGHRRFAILALPFLVGRSGKAAMEPTESGNRTRAYLKALETYGIKASTVPIFETWSKEATIHAALEELFASPSPPTAIMAESDKIALIALDWFKLRGISVPGDVSIIGFDGVPESATSSPPLTTIQQPIAEIGRRAVKIILEQAGDTWREQIDTELVIRGSTAPPRG